MMSCPRFLLVCCFLLLLPPGAHSLAAQEVNDLDAALSVNGTGQVDGSGTVLATDSALFPTPPGAAPLYDHRASARSALQFRVQGTALGHPLILVTGPILPGGLPLGGETLEINPVGLSIFIDGTNTATLANASAVIGPSGSWTLSFNQGLPAGFPAMNFQAAILDPTAPFGFRLTGSLTLEVRSDLDTLFRNFTDAGSLALEDPAYFLSLLSTGFVHDGDDGLGLLVRDLASQVGSDPILDFLDNGISPDSPTAPPLPAGGPTATSQVVTLDYDLSLVHGQACPGLAPGIERMQQHGVQVVEELGVWKVAGNQREVATRARLIFQTGNSNPQGLDVVLELRVEDEIGVRGGILSVSVTGPQLGALNAAGQSTSPLSGVTFLMLTSPVLQGPSKWNLDVPLAVQAAGTSRMPLVENAQGPRDSYLFVISFNDGSTLTELVPLRAAVDPDQDPGLLLAALPLSGAPQSSGTLSGAGTPQASLLFSFSSGLLPDPTLDGRFYLKLTQGAVRVKFPHLPVDPAASMQTFSLCVPGLAAGVPVVVEFERDDVFGNQLQATETISF